MLKALNHPATHIVVAAKFRKRLFAMIAALDRLALLVIGELWLAPILTPRSLARFRPSARACAH
jgi:hypothetical protein